GRPRGRPPPRERLRRHELAGVARRPPRGRPHRRRARPLRERLALRRRPPRPQQARRREVGPPRERAGAHPPRERAEAPDGEGLRRALMDWKAEVQRCCRVASFGPPCTRAQIETAERALGLRFPPWLAELLSAFDGFRGPTNARFLWPLADVVSGNAS